MPSRHKSRDSKKKLVHTIFLLQYFAYNVRGSVFAYPKKKRLRGRGSAMRHHVSIVRNVDYCRFQALPLYSCFSIADSGHSERT